MKGFSVSGFRELDRQLARMQQNTSRGEIGKLLRKGANVIAREERQLIHVRSGRMRKSITVTTRPGFDVPEIGRDPAIYIGPRRGAGSRAHLLEFGTIHSAAHPFVRPALDAKWQEATGVVIAGLTDLLKAAAR